MKQIKIASVAMMMMLSTSAFAQFSNTNSSVGSSNSGSGIGLIKNCNPYDRVTLDYVNRSISPKHGDDVSTNGFALDYIHGFSLSSSLPLFLETGIGFDLGFWGKSSDEDDYDEYDEDAEVNLTTMSISVPVNLAYKLQFTDAFSLQPFIGLNFKVNALAKYKMTFEDYEEDNEDWSAFDKEYMGKEGVWNRFQMGWHIGAGINYNNFYLGLSYGTDFIELCKKTNTGTFKIGVGLNF